MAMFRALLLLFVVHLSVSALVSAQGSNRTRSPWLTLSGAAPIVIAHDGFSGIVPGSSSLAYDFAQLTGLPNVVLWCDVQLTKDGAGICLSDVVLDNYTTVDPTTGGSNYSVNGESRTGHFSIDYTLVDLLQNIYLVQGVLSRSDKYNNNLNQILTVEDVAPQKKPAGYWLNIQHDSFFTQHNLSMRSFVLSVSRRVIVNYVSSPEVGFLRSIVSRFTGSTTKLIFCFLEADKIEPSTGQTYGSLLNNLTFIKTFSSGILVPKNYIWPVNIDQYLEPHTSLVADAHREGLQVFASGFANDFPFSYNYSYDPLAEYLSFIDNGDFSVDGVLSDFPITPSAVIDCFSHITKNTTGQAAPKIISHNGASGDYPGGTDLAYNKAVEDGADYIDCTVQMTSDGIPICLSSINLIDTTTVTRSPFSNLVITVPDIKQTGIFTFNLTWKDIQTLQPLMFNPAIQYKLFRNPSYRNAGTFQSLDGFLTLAKNKGLVGILISVENATFLAQKGLNVTGAVLESLSKAGYNNQTTQEVIIQSTNKNVLTRFKELSNYQLLYKVDENIRNADDASIKDIKSFAKYVAISKESVFPENVAFVTGATSIVSKLQSFNLTVYVYTFMNEFVEQAWDFFSDPVVEINSFVLGAGIDGVITDFPGTAAAYRRNICLNRKAVPPYMLPVEPGSLLKLVAPSQFPPAAAPIPILTENDVAEPPLPPVSDISNTTGSAVPPTNSPPTTRNSQPRFVAGIFLSSLSMLLASLLLL